MSADFSPFLALHIGADTISAIALGPEPPEPQVPHGPQDRAPLLDRTVAFRAFGLIAPVEAAAVILAFFVYGSRVAAQGCFPGGEGLPSAPGAAFVTVVMAQVAANVFACRSVEPRMVAALIELAASRGRSSGPAARRRPRADPASDGGLLGGREPVLRLE